MKRLYIFSVLLLLIGGVFFVSAQDLIILKDGNTIEARVIEISPTEIKYKRFDHLDGPTVVIMAADILSIRYENGRTEIINAVTQPTITTASTQAMPTTTLQAENEPQRIPRLNTIGATIGYQDISVFGFTLNGTVSPSNYTFFDFSLGLGFNSFAFNGRINFNAFVPFKNGGWYAGLGIGGGYNELFGGVIAGNITTGFVFFNWLNIAYTLQLGNFDGVVNHNIAVGYSYRFNSKNNSATNLRNANSVNNTIASSRIVEIAPSRANIIIDGGNYTVERIIGNAQFQLNTEDEWVEIIAGDVFAENNRIRTSLNSSLVLNDGNSTLTIPGGREGTIDSFFQIIAERFVVTSVTGSVQWESEGKFVEVKVGDTFTKDITVRIFSNSSLVLDDGSRIINMPVGRYGKIANLVLMVLRN